MDRLLKDLLPYKARLWLYLIVGLVALGLASWQAADGNWLAAVLSFAGTLSNALAAGNVDLGEEV